MRRIRGDHQPQWSRGHRVAVEGIRDDHRSAEDPYERASVDHSGDTCEGGAGEESQERGGNQIPAGPPEQLRREVNDRANHGDNAGDPHDPKKIETNPHHARQSDEGHEQRNTPADDDTEVGNRRRNGCDQSPAAACSEFLGSSKFCLEVTGCFGAFVFHGRLCQDDLTDTEANDSAHRVSVSRLGLPDNAVDSFVEGDGRLQKPGVSTIDFHRLVDQFGPLGVEQSRLGLNQVNGVREPQLDFGQWLGDRLSITRGGTFEGGVGLRTTRAA